MSVKQKVWSSGTVQWDEWRNAQYHVTVVGPLLRYGPKEFKQTELLNKILDDHDIANYTSDKDLWWK